MENEELDALPYPIKTDVLRWISAFKKLEDTPRITDAFGRVATEMGMSIGTLKRKYYAYRKTRQWQSLINRAKYPVVPGNLTYPFIRFWNGMCIINNGNAKIAHKQLLAIWKQGENIPGYRISPNDDLDKGYPTGWSYGNLSRLYKEHKLSMRYGFAKE